MSDSNIQVCLVSRFSRSRGRLYGMCLVIALSFMLIAHLTNDAHAWVQLYLPLAGVAMMILSMSAAEFHLYVERLGVERQLHAEQQEHVEQSATERQRIFNQLWQDLADTRGQDIPPNILADLSQLFAADLTGFWMAEDRESRFRLRGAHQITSADYERLDKIGQVAPCFEKLQERPGQLRVTDFRKQTAPALEWFCTDLGLVTAVFNPVMVRQELVGVLAFFYKGKPELSSKESEEMQSAANLFLCALPARSEEVSSPPRV